MIPEKIEGQRFARKIHIFFGVDGANYSPEVELAEVAGNHHEHLVGTGYPRGLTAERLSTPARILAVASRAEAILADRPRGPGATWTAMLSHLRPLTGRVIDGPCYEALSATSSPR